MKGEERTNNHRHTITVGSHSNQEVTGFGINAPSYWSPVSAAKTNKLTAEKVKRQF